jgi:2-succinyl-6-hydroxy-2,4-cyclohexadiene-1-carboxylate synthase
MLITGSEDSKYCRIATECLQEIPDCKWVNISNCGHNVHLEQSTQFIESIKSFLRS